MTDITKQKFSEEHRGWYGFDLDGTLAIYDKWRGVDHIGEPIEAIVNDAKTLIALGKDVRIFTARVFPIGVIQGFTGMDPQAYQERLEQAQIAKRHIEQWCANVFGFPLPITCIKDFGMIELRDDRAKQVIPNEGKYVEDLVPIL